MPESRIANVERDVSELKSDMRDLKKDVARIREKLFNGICKTVDDLAELLPLLMTKEDNEKLRSVKKPRRLEILATVIGILIGLQTLGILDGIRAAIYNWLTGGG